MGALARSASAPPTMKAALAERVKRRMYRKLYIRHPTTTMKSITASVFRAKMRHFLDAVTQNDDTLIIPRNTDEEDAVVVMSIGTYNSFMETDHLLSTASNRESLARSLAQGERGEFVEIEL